MCDGDTEVGRDPCPWRAIAALVRLVSVRVPAAAQQITENPCLEHTQQAPCRLRPEVQGGSPGDWFLLGETFLASSSSQRPHPPGLMTPSCVFKAGTWHLPVPAGSASAL